MDIFMACIGLASLGFMYWQVRIMMASAPAVTTRTEGPPVKGFSYWPIIGMGVLVIATWVPYFLRLGEPQRVLAMPSWGSVPDGCYVVMDGSKLQDYSSKY